MKLFTIKEAAKILRIHEQTLYRKLKKGEGPRAVKLGGKILIPEDNLEAFTNG